MMICGFWSAYSQVVKKYKQKRHATQKITTLQKNGYQMGLSPIIKGFLLAQKSSKQKSFECCVSLFLGIVIKHFGNRLKPTLGQWQEELISVSGQNINHFH